MEHRGIGETLPPAIGLPTDAIIDILLEETREQPFSGGPIPLQPLLIPIPMYRTTLAAAVRLVDMLRTAVLHIGPNNHARMEALGIPANELPVLGADEAFEIEHCADMARADVVITDHGPRFIEVNVGGGFGGLVHYQLFQQAWQRIRDRAGRPAYLATDAYAALAALIKRCCTQRNLPAAAALIGAIKDWGADCPPRYFDIQSSLLRQHGVEAEHVDVERLRADGPSEIMRRGFSIRMVTREDAAAGAYDLDPVTQAVSDGIPVIPAESSYLLHTKKTLALISAGMPWMSNDDRAFVERVVPWTRIVESGSVKWAGVECDLVELLLNRRENFVLKPATGWGGHGVRFGNRCDESNWCEAIDEALSSGDHVVQEIVRSIQFPLDLLGVDGQVERMSAEAVVSPFCIGGTGAGCFARVRKADAPGILNGSTGAAFTCMLGHG